MSIPHATAHISAHSPQGGAWPTPPSTALAIRETFKHCGRCFLSEADLQPLSLCGRCKQISYCSRKCQKEDWKAGHKEVCKEPLLPAVEAAAPLPVEYAEPVIDEKQWGLLSSHEPGIDKPYWEKEYALTKDGEIFNISESLLIYFLPNTTQFQPKFDQFLERHQKIICTNCPNSVLKTIKKTSTECIWQWDCEKNTKGIREFGVTRTVKTRNGIHTFCYNSTQEIILAETRALWIKNLQAIEIKKS